MNNDIEIIREALRRFNRRAGVLKSDPYEIGLSLSQGSALVDINRHGSLTPNDLASSLCLDKSSISRMLEVLVKKKLIEISASSEDRRSKKLKLTPQGVKAVKVINQVSDKNVSDMLDLMDAKGKKELIKAFKKMSEVSFLEE